MNLKLFGEFIKELREEKKLNQRELAEELHVDRTTVNKWEKGKSIPLNDTLIILSEYFEVTIEELLAGKRATKEETQEEVKDKVLLSLLDTRRKYIKMLKYTIILIGIILLIFWGYYFFTTYNSIQVYKIYGEGDKYKTRDGIMIVSNEKTYFRFGNIFNLKDEIINVESVKLFIKDENEEKVLFDGDPTEILVEKSNNEEIFKDVELNESPDEIYLTIYTKEAEEIIQLTVERDFENKGLLFQKDDTIENNKSDKNEIKLSKEFVYDVKTNSYKLEKKELSIVFNIENKTCLILDYSNESLIRYNYDFNDKFLKYIEYEKNNKVNKKLEFNTANLEILSDEEIKVFTGFEKNYLNKYFSEIEV